MPETYTCPSCNHAAFLHEAAPDSTPDASLRCPQCGILLDTFEKTLLGDSPPDAAMLASQPSAQGIDGRVDQTLDLKADQTLDWSGQAAQPSIRGYEIIHELGRGAVGVVFMGRDLSLNRIVALKMILSGSFSSPDQLARFQTETQAVAQLHHPNIVQIYDVGEVEGRPYCAFEFVDGGTLTSKVLRNPQPSREAAELVETLARTIHFTHQRGIVHRDLKPDNILLTLTGVPKLSDFGLAKLLQSDKGQTETGSILGTPAYMAPEQAAGKTKEVGPAADIWALGGILYYVLTGQPPFKGATMLDTLEQVRSSDPVAPRRLRPKLACDLETICLKCLQKDPHRRYTSAEALADDLRCFLAQEPIHARPEAVWQRALRQIKRRPTTVALLGLLVLVVSLLAGSLVWLWRAESSRRHASESNRPLEINIPRGLPSLSLPSDNPLTEARVELGKQLFFDKRLSGDHSVACASCHDPSKGWSNGKAFATGVQEQAGTRSVPSIVNVTYQNFLFWDGRASSLEEQALQPLTNPFEMALPSLAELEARLNAIEGYRQQFRDVFGTAVTAENVGRALAAYERTILCGDTPYDRYKAGEPEALSEQALRGLKLFLHKAHCSACHSGPSFSDGSFHNIGIGMTAKEFDVGREKVSGLLGDRGSFKTPSLREVARTAPYMHDGSLKTLEEVVDHYDRGGGKNPQLDEEIFPLKLTPQEKRDLVTFLRTGLTSSAYPFAKPPKLPD